MKNEKGERRNEKGERRNEKITSAPHPAPLRETQPPYHIHPIKTKRDLHYVDPFFII
jgi:hypothetical protein